MRPGMAKWKPEPKWKGSVDGDDEIEDVISVGDTQGAGDKTTAEADELSLENGEAPESDKDGEFEDSNGMATKMRKWKEDKAAAKAKPKTKTKKKVGATAHANFRTLNIKNKQSKGKGGGKFGKRR